MKLARELFLLLTCFSSLCCRWFPFPQYCSFLSFTGGTLSHFHIVSLNLGSFPVRHLHPLQNRRLFLKLLMKLRLEHQIKIINRFFS